MKRTFTMIKRTLPHGAVWYYRLGDDPKRSLRSTGIAGTEKNKRAAIQYVADLLQKEVRDVPTFGEYAENFFNSEKSAYLTRRQEQGKPLGKAQAILRDGHVRNYLVPRWGTCPIDEIPLGEFEDWLYGLDLSNQTKNHILYTASLILKEAVRRQVIKHNPLDGVEPLDPSNKRRDYLTKEELDGTFPRDMSRFLQVWPTIQWRHEAPVNYGVMCAVAVSGGLRSGEVRALRWKHVSWENGGVAVLRSINRDGVESQPKAGSSRVVLLPQRTMDLLSWWYTQSESTDPDDRVFPERDSRGMVSALRNAMDAAGVEYQDRFLDVHSLRHTYNTHMRELIEDVKLQQFTGHKSAAMTERYDQKAVTERFSRFADLREKVDQFPI